MPDHSAVAHLPAIYYALAPELEELEPPTETLANCGSCPMESPPEEYRPHTTVFDATVRCCTYNPVIFNYQVGRILRRNDRGSELMRARIANPDGVSPWAVQAPDEYYERPRQGLRRGFGTDVSLKCPYWTADGLHCSIWRDRNAVCRTWFCKHDGGIRGRLYWDSMRDLLRVIQVKLCRWLEEQGDPPTTEVDVDTWVAWFIDCAERMDQLALEDVDHLVDKGFLDARERVAWQHAALTNGEMPDTLGPCVTAFHDLGELGVMLEGYSHYMPSTWPKAIWMLFSKMDGTVTWRDALTQTTESLGEKRFTEADIREMYRLGILEARVPEDLIPGVRFYGAPAGIDEETLMGIERFELSFADGVEEVEDPFAAQSPVEGT